jgi:hypothetical protein
MLLSSLCYLDVYGIEQMADSSFENEQKWKRVYKSSPLQAILPEGPQKKFL